MWFSKSIEEVLKELNVDPLIGLSEEETKARLEKYGANRLIKKKKKSIFQMFIAQLQDWLIYVHYCPINIQIISVGYLIVGLSLYILNR
jgi:P-type Ca2+ transporter type 2C